MMGSARCWGFRSLSRISARCRELLLHSRASALLVSFCSLSRASAVFEGFCSLGSEVSTQKADEEPAWLQDLEGTTERAGRAQDKEDLMERLRDLGYM